MSESYEGQQYVGIDLHRRRSTIVRMTETGYPLEAVQITNSVEALRSVMNRAGEAPETVLEATYGGTGRRTSWPNSAPTCTWRIRWG